MVALLSMEFADISSFMIIGYQFSGALCFIPKGFNICILGASDTGKTYLAKAIGIKACTDYRVGYFHCEELLSGGGYLSVY